MVRTPAPIVVFAYNRPRHLNLTLQALAANREAQSSRLVIYCDGAKGERDAAAVAEARRVALAARGFGALDVRQRPRNVGLAASITEGVSAMLREHGEVIVFEDDLVASPHCLAYLNDALATYAADPRVGAIGCYSFPVRVPVPETFFLRVMDCFGWATWADRWADYAADAAALADEIERRGLALEFDLGGAYPYMRMLRDCAAGGNSSWAVRWYAVQFLRGRLCLYPGETMTLNIGMDGSGVHSGVTTVYDRQLAAATVRNFPRAVREDARVLAATADFLREATARNQRVSARVARRLRALWGSRVARS